ncbi:hypothetical protein JKF63_03936 [Porcisia hertigi]|uniref:Uncharacterized protein n=1 Tax=Porcisia hertigi TaxID=2761500 RepID=A0A836I6K5_9TRYP|nr:hypothetical protein JKF63_03936 [Porcisia hertigi]
MPDAGDCARESHFYRQSRDSGNGAQSVRRSFSSPLPVTAASLAAYSRPRTTRSHLIKRQDGRYYEPYSAIVERDDPVTVLCVQRKHEQVLVRHMPEEEWQRIMREGEEVHPGIEGETSLHIVAPSEMSTLPASEAAPSRRPDQPIPAGAEAIEPPVFDYFVAPDNRIKTTSKAGNTLFSNLQLRARHSRKELERMVREHRRAMLSVERRNIFLRQYQRDMQHRMAGTPLYTLGRELPEELVQLFFLSEDHRAAMDRAPGVQDNSPRRSGDGRFLFTIDRSATYLGERMPFAGQVPADGFVVVTVGPTADAFTSAWQPQNEVRHFSNDTEAENPFVPYSYGSAEYLPRECLDDPLDSSATVQQRPAAKKATSKVNVPPPSDRALRRCASPPR